MLLHAILSVLGDFENEDYYMGVAATVPKDIIFEALGIVKRAVNEGRIRKTRGAPFVAIVKRACADVGVSFGQIPNVGTSMRHLHQLTLRR